MSTHTLPSQQQDPARLTLADLQRAQAAALRDGDHARAAQYAVLVYNRVTAAQRDAHAQNGATA